MLLGGCMETRTPSTESIAASAPVLPRAHPGYVQWLRKQSLLEQAQTYTAAVADTPLQWGLPEQPDRTARLLQAASVWLHVEPRSLRAGSAAFTALSSPALLAQLHSAGVEGLFFSPTAENGALWHERPTDGRDEISFHFSPESGTDKALQTLTASAEAAGIRTGGGVLPLATGIGPDFFLAARHARDFAGLYMMVEIPRSLWKFLPDASDFLDIRLPDAALLERLYRAELLPPLPQAEGTAHDPQAAPAAAGWAITGPVSGTDGAERRWLYRWQGNILRPVLHWANPTGRAAALFSAALIRHTGMLRQTLTAVDAAPMFTFARTFSPNQFTMSDAAAFCNAVARENRKYGGWTLLDTDVPPALLPAAQATGVDFVRDSAVTPAALLAMLTGDSTPLTAALAEQLRAGIKQSRLARIMPDSGGMRLPLADSAWEDRIPALAHWRAQQLVAGGSLRASGVTAAALSMGLSPEETVRAENMPRLLRRHTLLTAFCAGLPGLFVPQGADLRGAVNIVPPTESRTDGQLPLAQTAPWQPEGDTDMRAQHGAASRSVPEQKEGIAKAADTRHTLCYPPLSSQLKEPESYASHLLRLAETRRRLGIAEAVLTDVPSTPAGCAAALLRLPDGKRLLLAANFSQEKRTLSLPLPADDAVVVYGRTAALHAGGHLSLTLDADDCVFVLLDGRKSATVNGNIANRSQRRP